MALTTNTNTLAVSQANGNSVAELLDKRLLEMIKIERDQFVFTKLGINKVIPKNSGTKTYTVRRANSLPVDLTVDGQGKALTEGIAPTPLKISYVKVSGTISQRGAYIKETDVSNDITLDNIKNEYQPELARHAAEVSERVIKEQVDAEGNEMFLGGATKINDYTSSTADAILDLQACRRAKLSMTNAHRKGHSMFGGKFVGVLAPEVMQDLLDDEALLNKVITPGNDNSPMKAGNLENYKLFDMYFTESQIIKPVASTGTGTPNVYTSYIFGKDPYMTIGLGATSGKTQFLMSGFTPDSNNPLAQTQTFGYKMWGGAKVIDPIAITKIYSLSNYDVSGVITETDIAGAKAPYTQA